MRPDGCYNRVQSNISTWYECCDELNRYQHLCNCILWELRQSRLVFSYSRVLFDQFRALRRRVVRNCRNETDFFRWWHQHLGEPANWWISFQSVGNAHLNSEYKLVRHWCYSFPKRTQFAVSNAIYERISLAFCRLVHFDDRHSSRNQ